MKLIKKSSIIYVHTYINVEYPFITHYKKGTIERSFFGFRKKIRKEDEYFKFDLRDEIKIKDINSFLSERNDLCMNQEGDIIYKPYCIIGTFDGKKHKCYAEDEEDLLNFTKEIKNNSEEFIEISD